jgi:hypothetical protein
MRGERSAFSVVPECRSAGPCPCAADAARVRLRRKVRREESTLNAER